MELAPIHLPGEKVRKIMRRVPKNSASQGWRYWPEERKAADVPRMRPGGVCFEMMSLSRERYDMTTILEIRGGIGKGGM